MAESRVEIEAGSVDSSKPGAGQGSPPPGGDMFSADGYFAIEHAGEGIFLSVFPAQGKGRRVDYLQVTKEITQRGLTGVDAGAVQHAVKEASGKRVRIAPPQEEKALDGRVAVELSRDKMSAYATVTPPRGGKAVTVGDVLAALRAEGIVVGLDEQAIQDMVASDEPVCRKLVARGEEPVHGEDARVEFYFETDARRGRPAERSDGRVDFYDLNIVTNVLKGQVLAAKIPATEGTSGRNVRGEPVPARKGKDVALLAGKNVVLSEDGRQVVAAVDGQVVLGPDKKISVYPVFEVRGNVDLSTGNINFVGSVVVRGDVCSGLTVKAEGDVEVHGGVDAAFVEAGGGVTVRGGIQGRNRGYVRAGRSVVARYIENARVEAKEDVQVSEAVMHSQVSAGGKVAVNGKKGLVVGGVIRAGEELQAKILGSALATYTEVEVGVDPVLREELSGVSGKIRELEANLDKTTKAIHLLREAEQKAGALPADRKELLLKLSRMHFHLIGQLGVLKDKRARLEREFAGRGKGRVRIAEVIYPGVRVIIGRGVMFVRDEIKYATLSRGEEDRIVVGAYE